MMMMTHTQNTEKPLEEIRALADAAGANASNQIDEKTGNTSIHIAAQNGHFTILKFLVEELGAKLNVQNFKGNTALHMSVEYDSYFQTVYLRSKGADDHIKNSDDSEAIFGLESGKVEGDAWDSPVNILKAAGDNAEEIKFAFEGLREAGKKGVQLDKAAIVHTGMMKKKQLPQFWDHAAFQEIVRGL
jgi:hypothetical protein